MKSKGNMATRIKLGPVALLLVGMGYLGLVLFLGTSTPFLLVRGTSMEPTYHAGDLLLSKSPPEAEIKVGDVIAFNVPADAPENLNFPPVVVHRVIGMEGREGQLVFITQGDNAVVDPFQVPPDLVRGVILKNLGPVGRPILLLTNKKVLLFVGLPLLAFIVVVVVCNALTPKKKEEDPAPLAAAPGEKAEFDAMLNQLSGVIAEFGAHLQSHTEIVINLRDVTRELRETLHIWNGAVGGPYQTGQGLASPPGRMGEEPGDPPSVSGHQQPGDKDERADEVE